jgi:ferredoxin-NADP reductase
MSSLKLIRKSHITDNVWTFEFEAHPKISWTPGQFIRVELPHQDPDAEGTKRWFTVSAAPFEEHPAITTRITSTSFKQALVNLPEEGELTLLAEPEGDFIWEESDLRRVFVAAGIGVTPFRSIILQRAHDHDTLPVTLVYANRTDDVPFRDKFDAVAAANPTFKVHYVSGGLLTPNRITKLVPDIEKELVYISGAEPMVETLGDGLRDLGLADDRIKQDFFPNYDENSY